MLAHPGAGAAESGADGIHRNLQLFADLPVRTPFQMVLPYDFGIGVRKRIEQQPHGFAVIDPRVFAQIILRIRNGIHRVTADRVGLVLLSLSHLANYDPPSDNG